MLYMIASFDFNVAAHGSREAAERYYLEHHVPLARRLPGLRRYVIGRPEAVGPAGARGQRAAILAFDDVAALRQAYRSEVGRALREDEKRLIGEADVVYVTGEDVALPTGPKSLA
jgi:uncharacterized protein (TIGR02118 family)